MLRRAAVLGALLALAAASSCAAATGGAVTFLASADVDYLDPGQTYYTFGYMVQYAVNRPLYSYRPDSTAPQPDLAAGPPEISADARTVTVQLRSGVRYAPPVDREVVAGDVEYALERAFTRNVPSGCATTYFSDIAGAPSRPGDFRHIDGIQTPDDHTLVLSLRRPSAALVAITIDEGNDDLVEAGRHVLAGSHELCCDSSQPPRALLASALAQHPSQVARVPAGGTRWVALNTRVKPFDRADVRRAVVAGMDRERLRATRGGTVIGPVAQHVIPPGIPGFAESGGAAGFTDLDFMSRPSGSRDVAAAYLRLAGYSEGRYTGRKRLLMIGTNSLPGRKTAKEAARQLRGLGFPVKLRLVDQDTLYTKYCGVRGKRYAICANVSWFKDFSDPESLLEPTFSGRAIPRFGNTNWAQLRMRSIDAAMDSARTLAPGADRNAAWAKINHSIVSRAAAVPYVWEDAFQLESADVSAQMNPYTISWDLSFTSLR